MVKPLLCAGHCVGTGETVVAHVEVGAALGELAIREGRSDHSKGSLLPCDGVKGRKARVLEGRAWGTCPCLRVRDSLLRREG